MENNNSSQQPQLQQPVAPGATPPVSTASNTTKVVDTQVTPGGTFLMLIVTMIAGFIPLFGSAFAMNYMAGWIADNSKVEGKKVKFNATYMEALSFTFFNILWLVITLGVFIFWFIPRTYRYYTEHVEYAV